MTTFVRRLPSTRRIKALARSPRARREFVERRARSAFFRTAHRFVPAIAVDTPDGRYYVSTKDPYVGYYTFMYGAFDQDALRTGLSALEPEIPGFTIAGRTVLDIGANIGTQTVPLLTRWSAGHVIAV